MKKYSKEVSCDARGQIVLPSELRKEISIAEGTAFWVFLIKDEGIILKKAAEESLGSDDEDIKELIEKGAKIGLLRKNLDRSISYYSAKSAEKGGFKEI